MTELSGESWLIAGGAISKSRAAGRFLDGRSVEPKATSMGIDVDKTFRIYESKPIEGDVRQYDLWIDDTLVWTGMGDDRVDALLDAIQSATGQADDLPDN